MAPRFVVAATALLAVFGTPAATGAQIVRGAPPPVQPAAQPSAGPASADPLDVARYAQREFEVFRRAHLPHESSSRPKNCDERVGRICYWYDETTRVPAEPDTIKRQRARLIRTLDSLARVVPASDWVAEQRVRYLAEAERYDDALVAARECAGSGAAGGWRCEILVGFALHVRGDYVESERVYDAAISHMGPKETCAWRDLSLLLDDVALGQYRALKCGDPARDAWAARTWALARTLYSMPGNDSRTEYFARMTMVQMLEDAPGAYQFGFDVDEREMLLRFGWPRAWVAGFQLPFTVAMTAPPPGSGPGGIGAEPGGPGTVGSAKGRGRGGTPVGSLPPGTKVPPSVPPLVRPPDVVGPRGVPGGITGGPPDSRPRLPPLPGATVVPREGGTLSVTGIEAFPAYRYIPAGFVLSDPPLADSAAWRPQLPPVMGRYAPPYAKALVPLEHQKAVFKRGDSALVVLAYETKGTRAVDGARLRAGLVVTPAAQIVRDFATVRDSAGAAGVLTVRAPWGPLLMSAEVAAPDRHAVARARYGIGPARGSASRVVLSDLLFYRAYGSLPTTVEEVAPHALPTERVRAKDKLGVYWEAYGTDPTGERMHVSLIVMRENAVAEEGGFFRRMARAIGIGRDVNPVSVSVDEVSARGTTTSARGIELDISTLTTGAYIVQLEITVAGQPTLRTEHRIEVVGP